jgi:hypothetical protein
MSPRQQIPRDQSLFSFGFDVGPSDAALLNRASADSRPMRPQYVVILCLDRILTMSPNCAGSVEAETVFLFLSSYSRRKIIVQALITEERTVVVEPLTAKRPGSA